MLLPIRKIESTGSLSLRPLHGGSDRKNLSKNCLLQRPTVLQRPTQWFINKGGRTKRGVALNEESALNEVVRYLFNLGKKVTKINKTYIAKAI